MTNTYPSGVFGSSGFVGITVFPALAVNLKYPSLLTKAGDEFVTILSFGVHVTGPLYPSINVISFSCGKSVSLNTVPSLAYVFPVVVILSTPVDFKNLTSIFLSGRSSTLGEFGSVGSSTLTICSHTYSHWLSTSNVEPSPNFTNNVPSFFPASADVLAGFVFSVTSALSKS